jgi:peptide-methionine (R)-S-oxide reductase
MKVILPVFFALAAALLACGRSDSAPPRVEGPGAGRPDAVHASHEEVPDVNDKVVKTEDEWKRELEPAAFQVLRKKGTERAFTGKYWNNHESGVYVCAGCGLPVFGSAEKFDSGTGWPSFWQPVEPSHVATEEDRSFFMTRTEVHCARCGGHLGHVFDDGPEPTGLRYCINSVSLDFRPGE